jgi:hypothetical protein
MVLLIAGFRFNDGLGASCPKQCFAGRPGGIRTPNTRIWSPMLYQLELLAYKQAVGCRSMAGQPVPGFSYAYLVSLCGVCLWQNGQYLLKFSLSGVVRLFFVVV